MTSLTRVANDIIRDQKRAQSELISCTECGKDARTDLDLGLIELFGFCSKCDLDNSNNIIKKNAY